MFDFAPPRPVLALIRRCDRTRLVDLLTGLSMDPRLQANHPRILTLIHLALVEAKGSLVPGHTHLAALLNGLESHPSFLNESPAEDVFVSTVHHDEQESLIFNGLYAFADSQLQRLLDAVFVQTFEDAEALGRQCHALLRLSNAVAVRSQLSANVIAPSQPQRSDWPIEDGTVHIGRATRFTASDLSALSVDPSDLEPFILQEPCDLLDRPFGQSVLCVRPLLADGDGVQLPIPSLVSPALRLRLSHAIASGEIPRAATDAFHTFLFGRWLEFEFRLRGAPPILREEARLPEPNRWPEGDYMSAALRFDEDKLALLVLLGCDWRDPPDRDIARARPASESFERALSQHLKACFEAVRIQQETTAGLTLVVTDTPGWGSSMTLSPDPSPDWFVVGMASTSLNALFADPAFNLIDFWKMLRQRRRLDQRGVILAIWPDPFDMWVLWNEMGRSFTPVDLGLGETGVLSLPASDLQSYQALYREWRGAHYAPTALGDFEPVERWIGPETPIEEYDKPLFYGSQSAAVSEFRAVVETEKGAWWLAIGRPPFSPEDWVLLRLLWEASIEWTLALARAAGDRLGAARGALELRLLPMPDHIIDADDQPELLRAGPGTPLVNVLLPPDFIDHFQDRGNRGDRQLVALLARSICIALDAPLTAAAIQDWVDEVTRDPDLKMIHVTQSGDVGLALDRLGTGSRLRLLQGADLREAGQGIVGSIAAQGATVPLAEGADLSGKAEVQKALNAAVDVRWARCRALLKTLDRRSLIRLTAGLIESLHRNRVDAERGALARSRLYRQAFGDWAALTMSQRDGAYRVYRVLIEMAVCECPLEGGRRASLTDVDTLAAKISVLILEADQSDAVRHNLVEPRMARYPDGSWSPAGGGAGAFMAAYLRACIDDMVGVDIERYARLYEPPGADVEFETGDPFLQAFESEFGVSLLTTVSLSQALQSLALELGRDVVSLPVSVLFERIHAAAGVSLETFRAFLNAFALPPRPAWDAVSRPYALDDVYPWIFERRLSLMLRPLVRLDDGPDPEVLFGARQLHMGFEYASTLLETGIWAKAKLQTPEAKAYVDTEINRRGDAFEAEVADLVRSAGWSAIPAQTMTRFGGDKALGDLDVLAVSPDGSVWVAIECKWFGAARTPREVANWLQDYHGRDGDKLDRHLKRAAWIDGHRDAVASALGLRLPDRMTGRIVTTTRPPLAFVSRLPPEAAVLTRKELVAGLGAIAP